MIQDGANADVVVEAIGSRNNLIVVSQSFGGYVAPIVCERVPATLPVLVAPMIAAPGASADDMFANTGYASPPAEDGSDLAIFYHDVEPALAAEALSRGGPQPETPGNEPSPLPAWRRVPTRCLLCRDDGLLPIAWLRRVVRDRLRIRE